MLYAGGVRHISAGKATITPPAPMKRGPGLVTHLPSADPALFCRSVPGDDCHGQDEDAWHQETPRGPSRHLSLRSKVKVVSECSLSYHSRLHLGLTKATNGTGGAPTFFTTEIKPVARVTELPRTIGIHAIFLPKRG